MNNVVNLLRGRVGLADGALSDVGAVFREEISSLINEELMPMRDLLMALSVQLHNFAEEFRQQHGNREIVEKLDKLTHLHETNSPINVVRQIDVSKRIDEARESFEAIKKDLEAVFVKNIASGAVLIEATDSYRHPRFTAQGQDLYNTMSRSVERLAKARGTSREKYANKHVYDTFFGQLRMKTLGKLMVSQIDKQPANSVYAAIIFAGIGAEYVRFLIELIESEKIAHITELTHR